MKRFLCAAAFFVAAFGIAGVLAAGEPSDSISVRIVPSGSGEKRSITLWQPEQHFHVVITNISKEPVRLWREWCSWGYYSLSFTVLDANGKETILKKAPRGWRKNFPDAMTLAPGEHMVFEVTFDQTIWPNVPLPEKGKSHDVKMKAVFAIAADADTASHKVWTGEASSPVESYTIYR